MKKLLAKVNTKKAVSYLAIVLVLAMGGFLLHNTGSWAAMQNNPQVTSDSKVSVEVRKAETMTIRPFMSYDATLLSGEEGVVGADVPGKVVQILFSEGDIVKKGTSLIVLDSQDMNDQLKGAQAQLAAVQATLPKAEANVQISQRNFNNAKALYEAGAVSANDLSDAETGLKVAQADLAALQANISAAQSGIDRLEHNMANLVIKAPMDGVVEDKNVAIGQYAGPGAPLAMIKDTSTIQAVIKIAQEDAVKIQAGQKAQVRVSGDTQVYEGTVSYVSTTASMASRTFTAKVEVPNPGKRLKPGSYANVNLVSGTEVSALTIPLRSVAGSKGSYYVFTAENGVARRTAVTLGATYNDRIEVQSGLTDGADVICTNINSLQDGDQISIAEPLTEQTSEAAAEQGE
ncbi:efflux RND transporter periplasmic adaptor subunit [Desulfosporosinus youngiae]|uniref:RND family efflux transporter, MFP subunit n=1 Tax=Desulfosporosinus youngiae DSM 17734 TaxID=768710 RepID=H5XXF1_9FIRM|nr:efflux RND transporter periplasmic adaptor subunit [Desulfosporosinus youngiae]EHQ91157.1 RND family efflux transporter, MFP subunit [Desulfosporosinus youngiae DSM 17734]